MSGHNYLADTNAFILLLDKNPALLPVLESEWFYCFITEIELRGKFGISSRELRVIDDLLSTCTKIHFSEEVNRIAIQLKQTFRIKTPDAIIAATAIHAGMPLLSFDKGFAQIKKLDLVLLEP